MGEEISFPRTGQSWSMGRPLLCLVAVSDASLDGQQIAKDKKEKDEGKGNQVGYLVFPTDDYLEEKNDENVHQCTREKSRECFAFTPDPINQFLAHSPTSMGRNIPKSILL